MDNKEALTLKVTREEVARLAHLVGESIRNIEAAIKTAQSSGMDIKEVALFVEHADRIAKRDAALLIKLLVVAGVDFKEA